MGDIIPIRTEAPRFGETVDLSPHDRLKAARERRAQWGGILRQRRQSSGLTARVLAQNIGIPSPTIISAVEAGRGRVPEGAMRRWAEALAMEPTAFAAGYLAAFEPDAYALLQGEAKRSEDAP